MSVKIAGMEMPKNCNECILCTADSYFDVDSYTFYDCPFIGTVNPNERNKDCPLQEVKE